MVVFLSWFVYILECSDGSLYTGITNDLDRRLKEHEAGKGAKYTRGRSPLKIVYSENADDKGAALRREIKIKSFSRVKKIGLIEN